MPLDRPVLDAIAALAALDGEGPVLVASDFDGVLAPLVDDPSASRPTPGASAALTRLAALPPGRARTALVSGRNLAALAELSSPPAGVLLVGSHGAERGAVLGSGAVETLPFALEPDQADALRAVSDGLEAIAGPVDGAWVEHKPSAAVLHTRRCSPEDARRSVEAAVELGASLPVHTMQGKDVVEIAVVETSKGQAIDALRAELGAVAVVYLGDDVTDERAFAVLHEGDLGIKVGPGETVARVRVSTTDDAAEVLAVLAEHLER
ncbi:trehalose-phosphatase [Sanguibacter suaedae]|uniref:trehalose-phosphatase n=1 Tax=Sanguibacter suaedae TaxID=2795737 RepID=UPI0027DDFE0C|nr:trehalose-phosphatase [Sanguibacter suaedae]